MDDAFFTNFQVFFKIYFLYLIFFYYWTFITKVTSFDASDIPVNIGVCIIVTSPASILMNSRSTLPVWLNGWVFVYELIGYGFEFRCCQLSY